MKSTVCANPLETEHNRRRAQVHQRLPDRLLSLQGLLLRVLVFLTPEVPHLLIQMIGKRGPLQAGIVTGLLGQIGGPGRLPPLSACLVQGDSFSSPLPCLAFLDSLTIAYCGDLDP